MKVSENTLALSRDVANRHALEFAKDYDGVTRASGFLHETGYAGPKTPGL